MENRVKILVVEDEMLIAAKISLQLTTLGYEVTGILPRGEEALQHCEANGPDIVLLDIQLKGSISGIETAAALRKHYPNIAIIYLTANSDEATFNQAKATRPEAFIAKPFKQLDLQRAVELAISRMDESKNVVADIPVAGDHPFILSDRIFIKYKEKMVKIMLDEILYIEAERNYSRIFTPKKQHILSITLKVIEDKLPVTLFQRVHRSYIINLKHVDEVAEQHVTIAQFSIPLGAGMKAQLLERLQTF
ncbi:MAG: response regulator [Chitinophagaceae bacterium]|jgi:DNA-binding LytR/AlgR family response regulator|nr:response regulator [Chitinophagaceae bacterium]